MSIRMRPWNTRMSTFTMRTINISRLALSCRVCRTSTFIAICL